MLEERFLQDMMATVGLSGARNEEFLGWSPKCVTEILCVCLRGSWLTTHAHPMPWLGQPTASWLLAVIGRLWPMEKKATCCRRLITAVTRRSGSSPRLQPVPGVSLLSWEVMTGGHPFPVNSLLC